MKTNRTLWTITRAAASSLCVLWLAGACGGATQGVPLVGSESHFLMHCTGSCGGGLDCIGGICTKACLTLTDSCADVSDRATCTHQAIDPDVLAVCDVDCSGASDCASLGAGYGCDGGRCRAPAAGEAPIRDEGDPDSDGSAGSTDNGGATVVCSDFSDQSPPPVVRGVTLVNTGTTTLYIEAQRRGCSGYEPHYVGVARRDDSGTLVPLRIDGAGCSNLCQDVIDDGWTAPETAPEYEGSLDTACPELCPGPAPMTALEPGATLFEAARLEYVPQRLPQSCADGIVTDGINCYQRVIPPPAEYNLNVRVVADPDCRDGTDCVIVLLSQDANTWFYEDQTFELTLGG